MRYWIIKVLVCQYILKKMEIWSGVTEPWQTTEDRATQLVYNIKFKLSHANSKTDRLGLLTVVTMNLKKALLVDNVY